MFRGETIVEALILLAVLLVVVLPIIAMASLLSVHHRLGGIDMRLAAFDALAIQQRLSALEAASRRADAHAVPAPAAPPQDRPAEEAAPADTAPPDSAALDGAVPEPLPALPPRLQQPGTPGVDAPGLDTALAPTLAPTLEERFGTRWVVWIGGLALALGGIFMVHYSIEQGYIGPAVRIALGALLAAALVGTGEWLRRQPPPPPAGESTGGAGQHAAYIPGILTAAGTTVAYATVYAAYALYGFIGPLTAFVLLGIVALATLAAALLHGPALAALGLVGAEASPALIPTETPNFWALYVYLAVTTAAAFGLARLRLWRWLAVTALVFGALWSVPGLGIALSGDVGPVGFHAVAGFGLAALLIVAGLFLGPEAAPGRVDALSSVAVAVYVVIAALTVFYSGHEPAALAPLAFLVAATAAVAWRSGAAAGALPAAAVMAALAMLTWQVQPELSHLVVPGVGPDPSAADLAQHYGLGAFFAVVFGLTGYLAQGRYPGATIPLIWSTAAVLTPLAILIALYYQIAGLGHSLLFAAIAVALAAWFASASELLIRREPRPGVPSAAALHAAGSAAALALALTFALERGWLTVGLALMAPSIAWVASKRPLPLLRWIAAAMALLVVARLAYEPRVVGDDLGTTPFFNWLAYGYGVPALAFWTAGWLLRCRADDVPSRMLDAAAILFSVLFIVLEIRHYMTGGDIYATHGGLAELALQLCALLAAAIGLERLRRRTHNVVHNAGALIVAALALLLAIAVLAGSDNPRISGLPVGDPFLNLILLGYGLPAMLATVLALIAQHTRPMPYRMVAAGTSVVLALAYLTLEVMRLYHGPELTGSIGDAEGYTFSAVWLTFGVLLLFIALPLDSKPTRLASAAVVAITTAKVFLFDLANLTGFWRALSFIGLGLVLVGIGYLYQRLLFPPRQAAPQSP
jgi:uncharacterized membrane protein